MEFMEQAVEQVNLTNISKDMSYLINVDEYKIAETQ